MKVAPDSVVLFDYVLTSASGEVLDSSEGTEPLAYLHGRGQIVPGLERALEGRAAGESFEVVVAPADAYGEHEASKVVEVPRTALPKNITPEPGLELVAHGPDGQLLPLWVKQVTDESVTLDGNHPLAGETLRFAITVREVRQATRDELSHGHAHGPGGAH